MRKLAAIALLCTLPAPAYGRWKLRDLDPTNRNAGIRQTARKIDPSMAMVRGRDKIFQHFAAIVAQNDDFKDRSRREGWTLSKCRSVGISLAAPIITFNGAALCAQFSGGEPVSIGTCAVALAAGASSITELACTQLCHDHHLMGC